MVRTEVNEFTSINFTNIPFNSSSAIYLGNFAIYFICKTENIKIDQWKTFVKTTRRTRNRHVLKICISLASSYVSNSLKQLIELVDSLTSASVPKAVSIGAQRCGLDFGRVSFSANRITKEKHHIENSIPAKFALTVTCNACMHKCISHF